MNVIEDIAMRAAPAFMNEGMEGLNREVEKGVRGVGLGDDVIRIHCKNSPSVWK
jgi:hypothetical protein